MKNVWIFLENEPQALDMYSPCSSCEADTA